MSGRVLRRPIGGWSARAWRREVIGWLWLAALYLFASGSSVTIYGIINAICERFQ